MKALCRFDVTQYAPSPHQTEGWIEFRELPEKVFARVADHAAMGEWVPMLQVQSVTHPHPVAPGESTIGTARHLKITGGIEFVETVVYWNPPYSYAYKAEGTHFPLKNYLGLFTVEPSDAQGGRFIIREYFDDGKWLEQAVLPHGAVILFRKALGNLARLIGGTEYAMTTVARL